MVQPYAVRPPDAKEIPLLVSIPHTGTHIPPEVTARLASDAMRALPMTDWHLHHLYDFLPEFGVTTIHATHTRFMADLNRAPEPRQLYPGRFETGLVATRTFWGDDIWREPPTEAEIAAWREAIHAPYHAELRALLEALRERHDAVVLIDAHSVASRASLLHAELEHDIYLGNRDGETCGEWLSGSVEKAFSAAGLKVVRNNPYKGGYITDHYGRLPGVEALQIEMCQRVYMDENDPAGALRHPRFAATKEMLRGVFEKLAGELAVRSR